MNIARLQEGTKVKIVISSYDLPQGAIGYVHVDTAFHKGDVLDRDGDIWIKFPDHVTSFMHHPPVAFCFPLKDVKVLCYCPKR